MPADTTSPEARLRAALDAAAGAPVPDGWEAIRRRLADPAIDRSPAPRDGGAAHPHPDAGDQATPGVPIDLHAPPGPWWSPARVMSVAAAALVLVAAAVGLLVRDAGPSPVATGPAAVTGWYVPVGLPDGWRVAHISYTSSFRCAERGQRWVSESGDAAVTIVRRNCPQGWPDLEHDEGIGDEAAPVDLGPDVSATASAVGDLRLLAWNDEGQWAVLGEGATAEQVAEAGRAAVADPSLAFSPTGFARRAGWDHPAGRTVADVTVHLIGPEGSQVGYLLAPPGSGRWGEQVDTVFRPVSIEGQELPLDALDRTDGNWTRDRYAGSWPGADITAFVSIVLPDFEALTPEELCAEMDHSTEDRDKATAEAALVQVLAALRPATTAEWQAFLATAETSDPALAQVADLAGVAGLPDPAKLPAPTSWQRSGGMGFTCPPEG